MTKEEVQAIVVLGFLLTTIGLTWALGPWALVGCGAALLVASIFMNVREG
jgi:hypothetical protein